MPSLNQYASATSTGTVVIANGATVSGALHLGGSTLIAVVMPAAFTGVALTFQTSHDGTTYQTLVDGAGAAVTCTVAASQNVSLGTGRAHIIGWPYVKVVSGAAEGAARTLILVADGSI